MSKKSLLDDLTDENKIYEYLNEMVVDKGRDLDVTASNLTGFFDKAVERVRSNLESELLGESVNTPAQYQCGNCSSKLNVVSIKESLVKCTKCNSMNSIQEAKVGSNTPAAKAKREKILDEIISKITKQLHSLEEILEEKLEYVLVKNDDGVEFRYDGYLTFQYDEQEPIESIRGYEWDFVLPDIIQIYVP